LLKIKKYCKNNIYLFNVRWTREENMGHSFLQIRNLHLCDFFHSFIFSFLYFFINMKHRSSGILLHPTSLPGRFGIGSLGEEARKFVDWLSKSGQKIWQILPLLARRIDTADFRNESKRLDHVD